MSSFTRLALLALVLALATVAPAPALAQAAGNGAGAGDAPIGIQQNVAQEGAFEPIRDDWFLNRVVFWLTILHNSDGESQLVDAGSDLEDFGGVARFKTLADELRDDAQFGPRSELQRRNRAPRGVVLLSSGDNFLPGPEFNASLDNGTPFYDSIALDLIGYDAFTLGNHDFDFGPDVLADFIEGFTGNDETFLSANLDFSGEPRLAALEADGRIASSKIVWTGGRRVGVIGATTESLPFIASPRDVIVNEVAPAVQREVIRLLLRGVTQIVLSSHLQGISEEELLASQIFGVDVIIAGGGDELLTGPDDVLVPGDASEGAYPLMATDLFGKQVPIVSTSGDYRYIGKLVVGFDLLGRVQLIDLEESGQNRVAGGSEPDAVQADPLVQALVVDPVAAAVQQLADNVIAQAEVQLQGSRPEIRVEETNLGNLCADSLLWQANALAAGFGSAPANIAIQNGGGIRNNSLLPTGDFTELDTFDILPFSNFVTIVQDVPRDRVKEIFENAASRVEFVDGRWAHVAGMTVEYDLSGAAQTLDDDLKVATPGNRVVSIALSDGTQIVADGSVVPGPGLNVATIDFLARGGDQYPYRGLPFVNVGVSYQQALENFIVGPLAGTISAADYPEAGEGRIVVTP